MSSKGKRGIHSQTVISSSKFSINLASTKPSYKPVLGALHITFPIHLCSTCDASIGSLPGSGCNGNTLRTEYHGNTTVALHLRIGSFCAVCCYRFGISCLSSKTNTWHTLQKVKCQQCAWRRPRRKLSPLLKGRTTQGLPSAQLLKWRSETKEIWSYIRKLTTDLDSPIIQMFMRPFGKPWVIVADFREAQDIQVNRQDEFDRSTYIGEVFGPLLPGNHVWVCPRIL